MGRNEGSVRSSPAYIHCSISWSKYIYAHVQVFIRLLIHIYKYFIFPAQTVVWPSGFLLTNKKDHVFADVHWFTYFFTMKSNECCKNSLPHCWELLLYHKYQAYTTYMSENSQFTYLTTEHYGCNLSSKCFNFIENFSFIFLQIHHLCSGVCASMQTVIGLLRKQAISIGSCCLRSR